MFFSERLQAVMVALREIVNQVATSGPGPEDAQRARLGLMLDFIVADRVPLFGMDVVMSPAGFICQVKGVTRRGIRWSRCGFWLEKLL
jgi:hypothetical protein